ncbi:N-formylglutamate amidohydrolase [Haematospirillum jordaniae]|uniref:N-formylglutamate amidohydrolase n=1 Tax=Haematospirillum jordaniae TaxID=1549855 RepID=UPI0014331482|nr:N-formylglutamate amidohydrolase [Haematospirillum jordaniae]NKD85153.1 N-formylglutamate amidohydrolase [Haematospirillum jordaniae]
MKAKQDDCALSTPNLEADRQPPPSSPFAIIKPDTQTLPLVLASPHSGNYYPPTFLAMSRLNQHEIRQSEDFYVHELFAAAPRLGAPMIRATFPRAYIDVNREPYELDPDMFDGPLPPHINATSVRVAAGLGTIARIVANKALIYKTRLPIKEAEQRIQLFYHPYHAALRKLIADTVALFGHCLLLDCHSMPSMAVSGPNKKVAFVLGDGHGKTCDRTFTDTAHRTLARTGWNTARNTPYAGGYTTRHYSQPKLGIHTLQIEINRALYMQEDTYAKIPAFHTIAGHMEDLILALGHSTPTQKIGSG